MVPPRSAFPEEGSKFGVHDDEFQLGKELGGGSQGRVYICVRLGTGSEYAVKIVNTKAIELRDRAIASLRREISVMRELHHHHIVNLQEAFWEGSLCFIVMDLARGGDLHGKLERGKGLGSEESSRHVSFQLLEGIAYMHSHKVIHRDLKPENVLIVRSYPGSPPEHEMHDVKIADFGLSKCLKRIGESAPGMTACGTLDYLAPEVITGHYDERIDFWSFGVLLYMMLCGSFPFEIEGVHDVQGLRAKKLSPDGAWQSLSKDAKDMVQGLLTVDPAERLDEAGCLRHPWLAEEVGTQSPDSAESFYSSEAGLTGKARKETQNVLCESSPSGYVAKDTVLDPLRFWHKNRKGVVKEIKGSVGNAVDYVEIQLRDGKKLSFGETGGFQHRSYHLHHDEVVLAVSQEVRDEYVGNSLVFFTSECQIIAFQGHDARSRSRLVAPIGSQITGLQFEGSQVTGIYLEKVPTDGSPMAVKQISGWVGDAVDKIELLLQDGSIRRYGAEGGVPTESWYLEADEFILLVEQGRRDAFLGNSVVFCTSHGRVIEFRGMQAARSVRFVAPVGSQICGLSFNGSNLARVMTCPLAPDDWQGEHEEHTVQVQYSDSKDSK